MAHLTILLVDKLWKKGLPGRHGDDGCPGLYFKITGPKAASWVLRYQLDGKRSEMGLGSYPALGLAEAREIAHEQRKLVRDGIDPLAHRRAERSKMQAQTTTKQYTVCQLFEEYFRVKRPGWDYRTAYFYANVMKNHVLPVIGEVSARDMNVALVRNVLDPIWTAKPAVAREIQQFLAGLFDYAEFYELRTGNPARGIQKYLPKQAKGGHRKALPYQEMPAFIAQLREYQNARPWYRGTDREALRAARAAGKSFGQIGREFGITPQAARKLYVTKRPLDYGKLCAYALELLILAGPPRSGEILAVQWQDIDLERAVLTMPRSRMKVKEGEDDHIIPLTTRALEIIGDLQTIRCGDYLFPGSTQGRKPSDPDLPRTKPLPAGAVGVPMYEHSLLSFVRNKIGRSDFDVHGFRKSFKNWATAEKRFRDIAIELSLDHAYGSKVERDYRDEQLVEERRELLQSWQNYLDGSSAEVISLPIREPKVNAA